MLFKALSFTFVTFRAVGINQKKRMMYYIRNVSKEPENATHNRTRTKARTQPQMRRQMLVPDLYVFTFKFLAYKKD